MKKNRILQITPDLDLAGAETMCEALTIELAKKNENEIAIICFYSRETEITKRLEKIGIKIYYLNKKNGFDFSTILKMKKVINEYKPTIVHTHRYALEYAYLAIKLSKYKNVKIVHTIHNIANKESTSGGISFRKKFMSKKQVTYVGITEIVKESICELYNISSDTVPVIYNGINLKKCIRKNNYKTCKKILHVGRFFEQKNHKFLIQIFEQLLKKDQEFELYLVGDGENKNEIESYVKENKIKNVFFVGTVSDSYEIMNKSDIFILPSKWEGMPMTIIEAMGTGLPVIAANVGGIPNMIDNGENGYIVSDMEEYVNIILKLKSDDKLREKIGKSAIKKAEMFSSQTMAEKYEKIYNEQSEI